jgi:GrpB-like predicted nucleotidyltransferase (UPF0157 family)
MVTPEQQKWIDHLSDVKTIAVIPYDPTCEEKFLQVKAAVQNLFGQDQPVVHSGASALKISGQDEIDIYAPVPFAAFEASVERMKTLYGEPHSLYPGKRAHFLTAIGGKHIDVFVINQDDGGWKDSVKFHQHLLSHPADLERYRLLKENNAGLTVREYYKRKTEFINEILDAGAAKR